MDDLDSKMRFPVAIAIVTVIYIYIYIFIYIYIYIYIHMYIYICIYVIVQLIQYTAHMFTCVKEQDMFYLSTIYLYIIAQSIELHGS